MQGSHLKTPWQMDIQSLFKNWQQGGPITFQCNLFCLGIAVRCTFLATPLDRWRETKGLKEGTPECSQRWHVPPDFWLLSYASFMDHAGAVNKLTQSKSCTAQIWQLRRVLHSGITKKPHSCYRLNSHVIPQLIMILWSIFPMPVPKVLLRIDSSKLINVSE